MIIAILIGRDGSTGYPGKNVIEVLGRPRVAWPLVAARTGYDVALVERVWHHEGYPGTLVSDLLDVLVEEDLYIARERNRAPRTRAELATLIDTSVLEEALGR